MKKLYVYIGIYLTAIIGLFLYSFTQIDLSLTFSRFSTWQVIEKAFQYIGYYQRPLSTGIYIILLILLFTSFIGLVFLAKKNQITEKTMWFLVGCTALVGVFSYNAFSYDLFNYIFDAKIVTHYHLNPYLYRALDFSGDPMLSFMHWVERTYPYGPFWLVLTVPLSLIGSQIFLLTFFLFKMLTAASYVATTVGIYQITKKISPEKALFSTVLFAFQPLVIIEGLISAHNDIAMIALSTWAIYFLMKNKNTRSIFMLSLSIGIKFATAVLLPVWGFVWWRRLRKNDEHWENIFIMSLLLSLLPIIAASVRTNFQPWYFLYVFPFAALTHKKWIIVPVSIFSLFALSQYIPFLYTGNWNIPIPTILFVITMVGVVVSLSFIVGERLLHFFFTKRNHATIA